MATSQRKQTSTSSQPHQKLLPPLWWQQSWVQASFLCFVALALYAQTLRYGYVLDDRLFITQNAIVQRGVAGISDIFTKHSMAGIEGGYNQARYRPFTLTTFALEQQVSRGNATVSHAVNIGLYALLVVVLFFTLRQIFQTTLPEVAKRQGTTILIFGATLLCAAHPTHTEIVANIKSRDILLGLLFSLVSLWMYIKYHHEGAKRLSLLAFGVGATALGLLSQEGSILMLPVLPLTGYFFTGLSLRKILSSFIPFVIITALILALRAAVVGEADTAWLTMLVNNPYNGLSWFDSLPTKTAILGRYLLSVLYPATLAYEYGYNQIPVMRWSDAEPLLGLVVYLAIALGALWTVRRKHFLAYCGLFFLSSMVIASNIVIYYGMPMSDRMIALATIPAMLTVVWVILKIPKSPKLLAIALVGILAIAYSVRTVTRNPAWESDLTLVQADVQTVPKSIRVQVNFASQMMTKAALATDPATKAQSALEAYQHLHVALSLDSAAYPSVYSALALYFSDFTNRLDSSVHYWRKAVRAEPSLAYNQVWLAYAEGNIAMRDKQADSAIVRYRSALAYKEALQQQSPADYKPALEKLYVKLGLAHSEQERFGEAAKYYEQALTLNPNNEATRKNFSFSSFNYALQQARQPRQPFDSTVVWYNQALAFNVSNGAVYAELGALYNQQHQPQKALEYYRKAVVVNPANLELQRIVRTLEVQTRQGMR